jgi:hypothetical protein
MPSEYDAPSLHGDEMWAWDGEALTLGQKVLNAGLCNALNDDDDESEESNGSTL